MNISTLGWFLVVAGVVVLVCRTLGIPFGRLPGDIIIERNGSSFMFPITSMILLSVAWSIIRHLITR